MEEGFFLFQFQRVVTEEGKEDVQFSFLEEGEGLEKMFATIRRFSVKKGRDFGRYVFLSDSRFLGRMQLVNIFRDLGGRMVKEGELEGMMSRLIQEVMVSAGVGQRLFSLSIIECLINGKSEKVFEDVFQEPVFSIQIRVMVSFAEQELTLLLSCYPEIVFLSLFSSLVESLTEGDQGVFLLGRNGFFFIEEGSGVERRLGDGARGMEKVAEEASLLLGVSSEEGKAILQIVRGGGGSMDTSRVIQTLINKEEDVLRGLLFSFSKRRGKMGRPTMFTPYDGFFSEHYAGKKKEVFMQIDLGKNKPFSFDLGLVSFDYKEWQNVRLGFLLFLLYFAEKLDKGGNSFLQQIIKRRMEWMKIS